jgi:ubiquinol-cytochrome c reductase cytochrome c1 subunit
LGHYSSYDAAALRRGFEVYRNVCSTCHGIKFIHYRDLVNVSHTEAQAKALAASVEIKDGPNASGEYFMRKGALFDYIPVPYENDELARVANNGALPPDLTLMCRARHGGPDYVFELITGYREPPIGVSAKSGLHYNPYFIGGMIAMAPPLTDGQVEYEDGTVATVSQMAKDVTSFLQWTSEPEQDTRHRQGTRFISFLILMVMAVGYWKRFRWSPGKTRRISWIEKSK